ncbi:hypothetical protein ATANTOWER_010676 [Ataeniobius toweri]|uniref:Uncharacterized protein n=1 Tax=Ataeniobius toweri TaxID=208326 RepID=A0ABU7B785_9TELE|nr:hypothetical protein [Ataeniobius toweri]
MTEQKQNENIIAYTLDLRLQFQGATPLQSVPLPCPCHRQALLLCPVRFSPPFFCFVCFTNSTWKDSHNGETRRRLKSLLMKDYFFGARTHEEDVNAEDE